MHNLRRGDTTPSKGTQQIPGSAEDLSTDDLISRRRILRWSLVPLASPFLVNGLLDGMSRSAVAANSYRPLNHFPRMVQEYFVNAVRQAEQKSRDALDAVKTTTDAVAYVESLQDKIRECFGSFPKRTPLNPRITGVLERDEYRIEKLIFESRPGFPVTANLYIPKNRKFPLPGVVGTCGHSRNGKAAETYQSFAQGLARLGYVCLIYDPIGQGERSQYVDESLQPQRRGTVSEHIHAGNQQYLVGEFFGSWRAWDGIRALDYLLTRPEVDPQHVGVTGNSGGGTMTTWLAGLESRWTMAAPSCFVTTFLHNMENELPADTEQCPPKALALGLDHVDFFAAMAPKPVVIMAQEKDFFDVRGAEDAYDRLKRLYGLLGKPDQIRLAIGPNYHGYSQENREAMYQWFNKATGVSDAKTEPKLTIEPDKELWCTPNGQVAEAKAKTVFSFTRERSVELGKIRGTVGGEQLVKAMGQVLKLQPPPKKSPSYRILRGWRSRGYPAPYGVTYAVETEPDIFACVYMLTDQRWLSRPPVRSEQEGGKRAILYISHRSSDAELREEPMIREILQANPDTAAFTCDVRGVGESQPNTCGIDTFDSEYGCDFFYSIHSLMLDRPYLGQKTTDVLRVLDWMASYGYTDVHLVAKGWGALAGTFAAVLSNQVTQVTLKNALTSYSDIAEHEDYHWPLATLLPDVLSYFDLPDCYQALQAKKLKQIDPWGQNADHNEDA